MTSLWLNGRHLTRSTFWWARNRPDRHRLFCVHSIPLDRACASCEAVSPTEGTES